MRRKNFHFKVLTIGMLAFLLILLLPAKMYERAVFVIVLGCFIFFILHLNERGWSLKRYLNDPRNFQYKLGFRLRSAKWFNDKLPKN